MGNKAKDREQVAKSRGEEQTLNSRMQNVGNEKQRAKSNSKEHRAEKQRGSRENREHKQEVLKRKSGKQTPQEVNLTAQRVGSIK